MKKSLTITFILAISVVAAYGARIGEEQARAAAEEFINGYSGLRSEAESSIEFAGEGEAYYAYNNGENGGFVIVAADDVAGSKVLGYSETGSFNADNMPPAMAWLLSMYAYEMQNAVATPELRSTSETYAALEPLISTTWGQDKPFNDFCPLQNGIRCQTGCVATVLAQIMNYHEWPLQGTGSNSYTWNGTTLSADFSRSTYDWANMADKYYNTPTTTEQNETVAQLMYDAGIASSMYYGLTASGSDEYRGASALCNYFGYAKDLQIVERNHYDYDDWVKLIYDELAAQRPIFYSGMDDYNGGHAFILDGYENGYFHVNWGWEGMDDGYFLLTSLGPYALDSNKYNNRQSAVIGIRPSTGDDTDFVMQASIDEPFAPTQEDYTRAMMDFVVIPCALLNTSITKAYFYFGFRFVDENGNAREIMSYTGGYLDPGAYFISMDMLSMDFPTTNGTYKAYPIFWLLLSDPTDVVNQVYSGWDYVDTVQDADGQYIVVTIDGNNIHIEAGPAETADDPGTTDPEEPTVDPDEPTVDPDEPTVDPDDPDQPGTDPTAVTDTPATRTITGYYDLSRREIPMPREGIVIVRYSDGSVEKIKN